MKRTTIVSLGLAALLGTWGSVPPALAAGVEIIPKAESIKKDRPRLFLRPKATPYAISLEQLKAIPRDADFEKMLKQLQQQESAAAQALVFLLTGDKAAADKAIRRARGLGKQTSSPFEIHNGLHEMALAYDWLYDYPGFTPELKAEVRKNAAPLVAGGLAVGDDHVFCNYIWNSNSGLAFWALAAAGDDPDADKLLVEVRKRFNERMFPAMEYLNGLPGDAMGYWYLYCFSPGVWTLLAAQSASEADLVGKVRKEQGDWLARQFDTLMISTLPNMRYLPWGDIQDGPDGGVTHEMAGTIDAAAWAMGSPAGAHFSAWLAEKRGLSRFYGESAIGYLLYTRNLKVKPAAPSFLAMHVGGAHSGQVVMRSGWDEGATVVGFRCTDFYGQHLHLDQGSFIIYRNGLLAVDAGQYKRVGGSQSNTEAHNTLLLGGKGQRRLKWQETKSIEEHVRFLREKKLETGDMPFFKDTPEWSAAAGQFAQAYDADVAKSCVRQLLFVRPATIVVVDQLAAPDGKILPEVQWLLNVPEGATAKDGVVTVSNGKSWLRCRALLPGGAGPEVQESYPTWLSGDKKATNISRMVFTYKGQAKLALVHLLEVGDGAAPGAAAEAKAEAAANGVILTVAGRKFQFSAAAPCAVFDKE